MKNLMVRVLIAITLVLTSCTSHQKIESEDEFAVDADTSVDTDVNADIESIESMPGSDLSLDKAESSDTVVAEAGTGVESKSELTDNGQNLSLEDELNSLSIDAKPEKTEESSAELSLDDTVVESAPSSKSKDIPPSDVAATTGTAVTEKAPVIEKSVSETPVPEISAVEVSEPAKPGITDRPSTEITASKTDNSFLSEEKVATINNVTYQSNENGGAVAISADQPLVYTTRLNSATNQFVVEVENSLIPKKLKRALNTKDMASSIGSVDIYQKPGSNITRFVVQLRAGATEPMIQPEGNSLLIIGSAASKTAENVSGEVVTGHAKDKLGASYSAESGTISSEAMQSEVSIADEEKATRQAPNREIVDLSSEGIMGASDLESFLINNNKYYGKKISIETSNMDIKSFFNFLAEESGVNLILDDGITGNVALKLVNVPWDQAFVLVLKAKKLAYKRQGTVLRVGTVKDFIEEEVAALNLKESRKGQEPIVVKRFFVGYTKIDDLEMKIHKLMEGLAGKIVQQGGQQDPMAASTGSSVKVLTDPATNSLIVSGSEKNIEIIAKFIKALDVQPQQVLIETKVVEAQETFTKALGVNWNTGSAGASAGVNTAKIGMQPMLASGTVLTTDVTWGSLNILGSLTAQLQLGEREDKLKILSAPRVAVLSNETATITQKSTVNIPKTQRNPDGTATTTFDAIAFGITLNVTPTVSNEGTVTLKLNLERSFLPRVDAAGPDSRNATTKLIVKSGQTAVIGGIFESQGREAVSGVTGLKDIPILGGLFKGSSEDKLKNELVMFVTPTILKPVTGSEKLGDSVF